MQVRRRRQADGEAVQVLKPEAQGLGFAVHSTQGKFVRDGDVLTKKWPPASARYHGAQACIPIIQQDAAKKHRGFSRGSPWNCVFKKG
jgi:hypothetical protein